MLLDAIHRVEQLLPWNLPGTAPITVAETTASPEQVPTLKQVGTCSSSASPTQPIEIMARKMPWPHAYGTSAAQAGLSRRPTGNGNRTATPYRPSRSLWMGPTRSICRAGCLSDTRGY